MVKKAVWLLFGKETFLKKEHIENLKKSVFKSPQDADYNFLEFYLSEKPLSAALDFAGTAPFLSDKKIAVLWQIEELEEESQSQLIQFIQNIPGYLCLCLETSESSVKKKAFLESLSELSQTVACHVPFEKDFPAWIQARAKKKQISIDADAAMLLFEKIGRDAALLDQCLWSLSLYTHPRTSINRTDVEALVGQSLNTDVFVILDSVIEGRRDKALRKLEELLQGGTKGYDIIPAIAGSLDRLEKAARLLSQGLREADLASALKVSPFFVEKTAAQAKKLGNARIARMNEQVLACDQALKQGALADSAALERLILSLGA